MAVVLISHGILKPFSDFVVERKATELFSSLAAAFRVLADIPRIHRHARICASPGPHFLKPLKSPSCSDLDRPEA